MEGIVVSVRDQACGDLMGVRILSDRAGTTAAMYCSTSGWAFGPVFSQDDDHSADERAEAFLRWLSTNKHAYEMHPIASGRDARSLTDAGMEKAYSGWLAQEHAQFNREDACEHAEPCTLNTIDPCEPCEAVFQREKAGAL